MKYFEDQIAKNSNEQDELQCPHWVSKKNASFVAWEFIEAQKLEKMSYIKFHNKVTHFANKQTYQIKASVVARATGVHRSTLTNDSSYSVGFSAYLASVNAELIAAKDEKIKASLAKPSRGAIQSSKDELYETNKKLRKKVSELESQKTEEFVRMAFDRLPLPIRKKLGIN